MTTQPAIRYTFLDVWFEPPVNLEGHLSWSSGHIAFYLHGADRFLPGNNDRGFLRGYSQRIFFHVHF